MVWSIMKIKEPGDIDSDWDNLASCYYLKREFLSHLHKHNYCNQMYYELHRNGKLVAGTIVYKVKTNILTFINVPTPVSFRVIGIPVSIASPPFVGDKQYIDQLLDEILQHEKGIILGLNFRLLHLRNKVVNMRTLPTMLLKLKINTLKEYEHSLRHPYRRRLKRITQKFKGVTSITSPCSEFNELHYKLYLAVMKTTTTKLEILNLKAFKCLPDKFELTTFYAEGEMIYWHILLPDKSRMYFYMCGINYKFRDQYEAYHNGLLTIIESALKVNCTVIDLGQTAEIAKSRIGGLPEERLMFIYHSNPLVLLLIKIFRNIIAYSNKPPNALVFKSEKTVNKKLYEDLIHPS